MKGQGAMKTTRLLLVAMLLSMPLLFCGGGIPVRIRIDEFTMDLDLDEMVTAALDEFKSSGLFPDETESLPELWPDNLPHVQYRALLGSPPIQVDLSPEPGTEEAKKYEAISAAEGAITRIDLNRLVLRVEASNLTVDLPEMRLQLADDKDADPDDRMAWRTIGIIPSAAAGEVADLEFEFEPGGESFMRSQLGDDLKEFALRVMGKLDLDTERNPRMPAGKGVFRLIVVATFFVDPAGAVGAAGQL